MRKSVVSVFFVSIFILGAFSPALSSAKAQTSSPPREPTYQEPCRPGQPCEDENGELFFIPTEESLSSPNAIGDSDDYGYTLSSTTFSWIGANNGTDTGIDDYWDITGAITLPFSFPFYENTYSTLYITGAGYLTFTDGNVTRFDTIPDDNEPNNFISVLRQYFSYSGSNVYYKDFGTYFVVQWNKLKDSDGGEYTFEAVLYPNGNISFQYRTMPDTNWGYYCSTSGIENNTGTDGLAYWDDCNRPANANSAVLFTRPGPSARVGAYPLYLGEFAYSQDVDEFTFTLTNNGNLGTDVYDMTATTAPLGGGWSVGLFDAGAGTPLSDTDADGVVDSGSLAQGVSKEILVRVSAPAGLTLGAAIKTYVDISSSLNPAKTKTVTIESTVPAAFAQTYKDSAIHTLRTEINWPVGQVEADIDSEAWNVNDPVIIETKDHNFVHVWMDYDYGQNTGGARLDYAVVDRFGQVIKAPTTLSPIFDVAGYYTDQYEFTLAEMQDGKVGVVWARRLTSPDYQYNYNIWFAIISPSGTVAYGPVNLTNNNAWGSYMYGNNVGFYNPDISTSSDNRFFITWGKYSQSANTEDIFYTICQSNGTAVVPVTAMTASVSGSSYYYPSAQIALSENRFFVTYEYYYDSGQYSYFDLLYRVFDSSGNTLVSPSNLNFAPDTAIQLSGGNILLASTRMGGGIRYQIRNGTTYALIYQSDYLSHPSSGGSEYGSLGVTKDSNNRGILTWKSDSQHYLYYAYVQGSNGALLSGPVIFKRSDSLGLSYNGSSLTTNSWSPSVGIDLVGSFSSGLFGSAPGGVAVLKLQYNNIGIGTAESPKLTLTLPTGLTWGGDTSGITPALIGNTVVWQLPELGFGSSGEFNVYLAVDNAISVPSFLDLSLSLSSEGTDANPSDNFDTAQVMVGLQEFLPILLR